MRHRVTRDRGSGLGRVRLGASASVAAGLALALVMGALPTAFAATAGRVDRLTARRAGATLAVSGHAVFGAEAPEVASVDVSGDGPPHSTGAVPIGSDLHEARIYQPDPKAPKIVFEWAVDTLPPPTGSIPEVNRYLWGIHVANGSLAADYVLQAKYSNVLSTSTAMNPADHLTHIGNAFQLRGNCGTLVAVSNCDDVAWLEGAFDTSNNTVRMVLPIGQSYAPELVPGALITPFTYGGAIISACLSVVLSNAETCDDGDWSKFTPYRVGTTVMLGVGKKGTPIGKIKFTTPAKVSPTGAFTGSLKTRGLHGSVDVWARACTGASCTLKKITVTV